MKEEFQARMLQIHFGESDKPNGKPLLEAIVAKRQELGMAGAIVYCGIGGYEQAPAFGTRVIGPFPGMLPSW